MDGTLQYQISLENAQAIQALERFSQSADKMAAKIDGIRTTAGGASGPTSSLFDKIASAGSNIANTVAGVEALGKAIKWLKGAEVAAAASAQVASTANAALAATSRTAAAGATAGAVGLGLFGGAAAGATVAVGAFMASLAVILPVIAAISLAFSGLQALSKGIGLANEAEKTAIAFKTLTGNAEQAQAVIGMLSQMAIDTPFNEAEIQGGARALLAARVPASQLKTELRAIGNIASATNGDVGRLATVYAQVAGKGKLYAEELQQFVEQGAGELRQAVASTLGVTTAQLMEMMQAGEVGFSTLQQAIQDLAGETGKWGGAMADQSQTNLGLLSSLGDNVAKILRLLATPISDGPLKAFLAEAVSLSSKVSAVLSEGMRTGQMGEVLKQSLILGAKLGVNELISLVASIPGRIMGYLENLAGLVKAALSGSVGAFAELKKQLGSFDLSTMQFDTSEQTEFFKKLVDGAKTAGAALEEGSKTWAEDLDSTGKTGDAAKAGKAQADAEAKAYKAHLDQVMKDSSLRDDLAKEKSDAGQKAADNLFGNKAYQVKKPAAAPRAGGGYRDNSIMAAAQVAGEADAKIQGYSREKQGGADAARARAAAGMNAARGRVEADTARGFGTLYNPRPTAPGAAVNATLTPGGPGQAAAGRSGGADSGNAQLVGKLDAMIAELQRIRTE